MLRLVALAATLALCAACTDATRADTPADVLANDPSSRPGDPAVYRRIETSTDCVGLQREFDTAMDNVDRYPGGDDRRDIPFSYARAADNRMEEVGCYG